MLIIKKTIFFVSILLLFFTLFVERVYADDFKTTLTTSYVIDESARANVTFSYSLENLKSEILVKEFHVNFTHLKPENIKVTQNGKEINFSTTIEQNSHYLKIVFPDDIYGLGKKRTFDIFFNENNISKKTGNIVEISIPKINADDLDSFQSILTVPTSIGQAAYITPSNFDKSEMGKFTKYVFKGAKPYENGINAAFGEFQVFDYILNYNLENMSTKSDVIDVAFPPDTQYQRIFITNIEPKPFTVKKDDDGNWIYGFKLGSLEKITVKVEGSAQLFSNPRSLTMPTPQSIIKNLDETTFWQTNSEPIKKLALELKNPQSIYEYVTKNLRYDYSRVNPESNRLGAVDALKNNQNALCTEFTDLFIAIARSAGIPAREVQGYANTENGKLQPLSLVSDVLHAWPQYWDNERKSWISVDPTWESTTGVDYFNKFDLNHFAFAIHGVSDEYPLPAGSYKFSTSPKKDVYVSYGKIPVSKPKNIEVTTKIYNTFNPFKRNIKITIENKNNNADYNKNLKIYTNDSNPNEDIFINSLIPYEKFETMLTLNYGFLVKNAPEKIKITYDDQNIEISSDKEIVLISQIVLFMIIIFLLFITLSIWHKRTHLKN